MKRNPVSILIIALSFASCERVIDINLNEANPKIVIEANIHNNNSDCLVKITRTGNYFLPYTPEKVSKAVISLTNQLTEYSFSEIEEGVYRINKIGKLIPTSYSLSVNVDGELYEAVSKMPTPVRLNYLNFEYVEETYLQDAGYRVNFSLTDPKDEENHYRVRYSVNGELQNDGNDYYLITDELFNGNSVQMQLYGKRFDKGDKVTVELMSIDKNAYDYFNTLLDVIAQSTIESTAPANPKSNFSNGALGYFSAYSSDIKFIIVGESNLGN
ncbi:MAG: hypothetical protein A2W90_01950 [Bacteroidetes bacterium GWF2_42_66]|nr:MAG: hypothetical protein A2W92_06645 [Bacteroidetes bacterium GWA2_42_15]OFY01118.1 MAG: hypothetical protein A2W89_15435 [Bacteroidetes bacterium GWE2_42_39]OFY41961.1 MAG: hypothetical protein A2W90_01950 [Bacteroidetes bacterium GWF2_42_66]HBL77843.1 hypothetical protein [Prolixibacteraceae bacterium]HCR90927.1 hypothetical protein [Prolixibacteraceae bacterium]